MADEAEKISYFHLSGAMLAPGSIIMPGNWGRMIRAIGWQHSLAMREMALENAWVMSYPNRPSRLDASFVLPTLDEARNFKQRIGGFANHLLYRVTLCDPTALSHVTDSRLCAPTGNIRNNWADVYWMDFEAQAAAIPGIDWAAATGGLQLREMLTLSQLRVEERLD
jgi:hypothetical protein